MKRQPRKSRRRKRADSSEIQIREVMQLERAVWRAAKERNAEAFAKLVPADALMIFRSGIMAQPDYLATMPGRTLEASRMEGLQGRMPNSNTVILTYRTVRLGSYEGRPFPSAPVIESTTWIRRGKRWVAVLNQETPIKE
jgi:hypothetical protein